MKKLKPETRTAEAASKLRNMAHRLGPHAKLPTVRQLKSDLGVSLATLDSALNHLEREGVVRRRHGLGLFVDSEITVSRVALVYDPTIFFGRSNSPFWTMLAESLYVEASRREREVLFHLINYGFHSDEPDAVVPDPIPAGLVMDLQHKRVDGVIAVGHSHGVYNAMETYGVPISAFAGYARYVVLMDSRDTVRAGCRVARQLGCFNPYVWIRGSDPQEPIRQVAEEEGMTGVRILRAQEEGMRPFEGLDPSLSRMGLRMAETMEVDPSGATMVISTDDMFSQGLLMGMRARGLEPRRDFHLFSHGNRNSPTLAGWEKDISTALYDTGELASKLFDLLDVLIRQEDPRDVLQPEIQFSEVHGNWGLVLIPELSIRH